MSRARAKGTAAETALTNWLRRWWPFVERRALNGALDRGDIAGIVGVCIEVKNQKTYQIPAWMREMLTERDNDGADHGVLIVKPNGVGLGSVGEWWAITTVMDYTSLLLQAGYGDDRHLNQPSDGGEQ